MLEGLPSTGKTTNARLIHIQLERNNVNVKWIHEVAMPHPVLFFDEVGFTFDEFDQFLSKYPEASDILNNVAVFRESTVGIHLPEIQWNYMDKISEEVYQALLDFDVWKFPLDVYKMFALEKWAYFTEQAIEKADEVYVIDSAIFQFQIFTFLFKNRPFEELKNFIDEITNIINPLNPCLFFLHRENTEATIDYLENDRGTSYLEYIWSRDKDQPYYAEKPPGTESFKQFLRDYADMAGLLFEIFPFNKLTLEISDGNWVHHEDKMLSFLGINRIKSPEALPSDGTYTNGVLGFSIKVDGLSIVDPKGIPRKLFPKSQNEFYVDWLPTVLRFEENCIVISGLQVCEHWTKMGLVYERVS